MRVRLIFKLKNRGGVLPFHHQHLLAQLVKGLIVKGGQKKFVDFTEYNFSGIKGQTRISRKGLHFFSSRVTLVFSSSNDAFVDYIKDQLFAMPSIELGSLVLLPESVENEEKVTFSDHQKFVCISPLILNEPVYADKKSKRFIHPDSDEFSDFVFESTLGRMLSENNYSENEIEGFQKFQIVPDLNYIKKLDEGQKKYARIYAVYDNDIKYEVRGYTFPFTLYAHPKVLEFIYSNGIGYFAHKGFGMVDLVADSKPSEGKESNKLNEASH